MRRKVHPILTLSLAMVALGSCESSRETTSDRIAISGAVYVDFHVDLPCAQQQGPEELSAIDLTLTDATGATLGRASTGPLQMRELQPGQPGTEGWANAGCRFFAAYSVTSAPAASYRVEFTVPPPKPRPGGGYFQGVQDLVPQTITHDELRANSFRWSFEVQPAFVVP